MSGHRNTSERVRRAGEARERIARLHNDLLGRWQDDLREVIGLMTADLKRYQGAYEADFRGSWAPCGTPELERALRGANVILSGDYHTLPASQRLPIRLLRRILPRDRRPTTLALEMLHSRDQADVDRYLAGRIGLEALRQLIGFDRLWGFDWRHYGALLRFAREQGLSVLGINCEPGVARGRLQRRDEHAADLVVGRLRDQPDGRIYLLAGDWHVARAHLPRLIRRGARAGGIPVRLVVIHQNHDELHRRLGRNPGTPPTVARRGRSMFCVLNATPLVKADSHLQWAARQGLQTGESAASEPESWPIFDPVTTFQEVDQALRGHLGLRGRAAVFRLVGPDDEEAPERLAREAGGPAATAARWRSALERGETVWIRPLSTLLLGHAPVHRLAEAAARRLLEERGAPRPAGRRAAFYSRLLDEAAAFFASRLFNPDRKCDLPGDLTARRHGMTGAWMAAWVRALGRHGDRLPFGGATHPFWTASPVVRRRVARALGQAWGWYLFEAYTDGAVDRPFVRDLFRPGRRDEEALLHGVSHWPAGAAVASKNDLL